MSRPSVQAQLRIDAALKRIQNAQGEMGRALAELSTLRRIGTTWGKGSKLYDQVHAYWYRVAELRDSCKPITVDSEPEDAT